MDNNLRPDNIQSKVTVIKYTSATLTKLKWTMQNL